MRKLVMLGLIGVVATWFLISRYESVTPPALSKPRPPGPPIVAGVGAEGGELVHYVRPIHPGGDAIRVQGVVRFRASIGQDGRISNLTYISGHPLLVNAAKDAVLQWCYKPAKLNGAPVEVMTEIAVNFTSNQ